MRIYKRFGEAENGKKVLYEQYELDEVETEELKNTGYLEFEDLGICITFDTDDNVRVYKNFDRWTGISMKQKRYNSNLRNILKELSIRGDEEDD